MILNNNNLGVFLELQLITISIMLLYENNHLATQICNINVYLFMVDVLSLLRNVPM